jgi:hypothetical protein
MKEISILIEQIHGHKVNNRPALTTANLRPLAPRVQQNLSYSQARFMQNADASAIRAHFVTFGRTVPNSQDLVKTAKEVLTDFEEDKISAQTAHKLKLLASPGLVIDGKTITSGLELPNIRTKENKELLKRTLNAMVYATEHKPEKVNMPGYTLHVNNKEIVPFIKEKYTPADVKGIRNFLEGKKVFDLTIDKESGLVKTSGVSAAENFEMGARYWSKDSVMNLDLQKTYAPETCAKTIKTWARFFKENQAQLHDMIADPGTLDVIRAGKANRVKLSGMPHIGLLHKTADGGFILTPDSDFNRFRQEAHGHMLNAVTRGIIDGAKGRKYGVKPHDVDKNMIDTVGNLTRYFEAIEFHHAPSNGNWEESPFKHSSTHDTAVITNAIKSVRELMHDEKLGQRKPVQRIRKALANTQYGDLLQDKNRLDKMIEAGEKRVIEHYNVEAPALKQGDAPERVVDASQIFTVSMAKFHQDPIINAQRKFEVLQNASKELEGDFGLRRYNADSYLGKNYEIAADSHGVNLNIAKARAEFGSKDCSTPELMAQREKVCGCPNEQKAQWFFASVMSKAYGTIASDLAESKKTIPSHMLEQVDTMIQKAHNKQVEYFNKTLASVTAEDAIKSNGVKNERCGIPEAYEFVSTFERDPKTKEAVAKPIVGQDGSLTWAQTETLGAFKKMAQVLKLLASDKK